MKKLLNKKGSVLFLVVVVMSLLIIAASATYYVVSSQRSSVEVHYATEQSYQTALSVSESVSNYIDQTVNTILDEPSLYDSTNNIVKRMINLPVGNKLDAEPMDLQKAGLGEEVNVTIEKYDKTNDIENGKEIHWFNITTTSQVNGETVQFVQVKQLVRTVSETEYFTRFLTSTGNRPEDVILNAAEIYGDAYFENDYTRLGNPDLMRRSLFSSGTLVDTGLQFPDTNDLEMIIGKNLYIDSSEGHPNMAMKGMFVGGDLIDNAKSLAADVTYVLGDLKVGFYGCQSKFFVQEDCYINTGGNNNANEFYINGDLHLGQGGDYWGWENSTFYVNGNVYLHGTTGNVTKIHCSGNVINAVSGMSDADFQNWKNNKTDSNMISIEEALQEKSLEQGYDFSSWQDVANYISASVAKGTYQPWNAYDYFMAKYNDDAPVIKLDDAENDAVTCLDPYNGHYRIDITESCTIQPADWTAGGGQHYIIVDTTEAEAAGEEALYIKLDPNNASNIFAFSQESKGTFTYMLVKGNLPVVLVLPDNADFQMDTHSFIGDLDLVLQLSGYENVDQLIEARSSVYAQYIQNGMDNIVGLLKETDENGLQLDLSKFRSGLQPHNNIYLVTNGSGNTIHFDRESCFSGYVYAPNSYFDSKNPAYRGMAFLGGLIVGSYSYQCIGAQLVYIEPYDEYNGHGDEIVSYLIGTANEGAGTPLPDSDDNNTINVVNLGYK